MSRGYLKTVSLVGVLLALAGAGWFYSGSEAPPSADFNLGKVESGDITATVSSTGTLSPVITVTVGSQVSGTIQHLYADFNSRVKKNEVIAQIDASLFEARLAEVEANLESAQAAADKAWVAVLDTRRQLARQEELRRKKLVAESIVDAARFAYKAATVEHKFKLAAVAQARAARDREKVNLAYTTIYAPIDGVVISRDVDVGQTVAASLQAPTLFTIAQDLKHMLIEADVDEAFIGMIEKNQPVSFRVFAYPERRFRGKVAQVRLNPRVDAGVVKYNCIIHVDNADLALKPGMTATVNIEVARHQHILKVPNAALRYVPDWPPERLEELRTDLRADEGLLWLPAEKGLKPIKVKIGTVGDRETEVSGPGVQDGMRLALPAKRGGKSRKRRFGLSLF